MMRAQLYLVTGPSISSASQPYAVAVHRSCMLLWLELTCCSMERESQGKMPAAATMDFLLAPLLSQL
jgi:hypothetical protein